MSPRFRKGTRRVLALAAGLALALLALELAARWLLFADQDLARQWGARLRSPECLADPGSEEYWKLQWMVGDDPMLDAHFPDAELGWLGFPEPERAPHADEAALGKRRPVLLFGDSFAQCNTEPGQCFQDLLDASELGAQYGLLNYGVGGYGVDQIALLVRRVLPRFAGRKPIVVVGMMLDDDFNRSVLGLRCWPKPRARLEDGRLVLDPPAATDARTAIARDPPKVWSWAWRLLVYRDGFLPAALQVRWRDRGPSIAERSAVNRALLERIAAELDAAGVEHFFLFFSGDPTLFEDEPVRWTLELARAFERESGQPCVWTAPYLRAAACGEPERARLLFGGSPRLAGHYNATGNRVAFEALRQGIEKRFGAPDLARIEGMCQSGALSELGRESRRVELLGLQAELTSPTRDAAIRFLEPAATGAGHELWLGASVEGETRLVIELGGRFTRLRARAERSLGGPAACVEGQVELILRVDGAKRSAVALMGAGTASSVELDLAGAERLTLALRARDAGRGCGWLVLRDLVIE